MTGKKVLITGVSSGIGRHLAEKLVRDGYQVFGIARRQVKSGPGFIFLSVDLTDQDAWEKITRQMVRIKFIPDIIILNAAILENDLKEGIDLEITNRLMETNFFAPIRGVEALLKIVKKRTQFIAISSLSALKGSGSEGIGYAASKAALSVAFESLHQKFKKQYFFQTIYFGPVKGGMGPFKTSAPFILKEETAVDLILQTIKDKSIIKYCPWYIFFAIKIIKLLPYQLYFTCLTVMEHIRNKKLK